MCRGQLWTAASSSSLFPTKKGIEWWWCGRAGSSKVSPVEELLKRLGAEPERGGREHELLLNDLVERGGRDPDLELGDVHDHHRAAREQLGQCGGGGRNPEHNSGEQLA